MMLVTFFQSVLHCVQKWVPIVFSNTGLCKCSPYPMLQVEVFWVMTPSRAAVGTNF